MLTLGTVIMRLSDKNNSDPIPYRDSKLTRVLRPALEGNTKIAVICNISPSSDAVDETLSTLKFAQRAKRVKQTAVKNEPIGTKMLILKYENEILTLQTKLKEMESTVEKGFEATELKQEIGVIKEQLNQEINEKVKLNEAFEQALLERAQLEAEIAKLKSRILVSENTNIKTSEADMLQPGHMERRIMKLTVSRDPVEENIEKTQRVRTSSIIATSQEDFCRKTIDSPEEAANLHKALVDFDLKNDYSYDYNVRDTMLLDKIDNFNALFEGFNPRNSTLYNKSLRDSLALLDETNLRNSFMQNYSKDSSFSYIHEDKNQPTREQLLLIVAEQDNMITIIQKDVQDKIEQIELLRDELNLCRQNMKGLQKQIRDFKKENRK